MTNEIISTLEDRLDEQITVVETLYGKYDKAMIVENDLSYCFQLRESDFRTILRMLEI